MARTCLRIGFYFLLKHFLLQNLTFGLVFIPESKKLVIDFVLKFHFSDSTQASFRDYLRKDHKSVGSFKENMIKESIQQHNFKLLM